MRRRRQKNTLLPKMLGLAVLINAILLPILAQFGVFKSIGGKQRLTQVEMVKLPPPEKRPPQPKKTQKKSAAKPHPAGPKAVAHMAASHHAPSGPPPIKVIGIGPKSGDAGSSTDNITTEKSSSDNKTPVPPPVTPAPSPDHLPPTISPEPAPPAAPVSKPAPPLHIPTLTAAVPVTQPRPEIPDELRDEELHATFEGLFTVRPDGTATIQKVLGTGNAELDTLALETARRWTFRPATRDGQPVASYLRLKFEFDVGT